MRRNLLTHIAIPGYFFILSLVSYGQNANCLLLQKPSSSDIYNYSGDEQSGPVHLRTHRPIRVMVTDTLGNPVSGIAVSMDIISIPKGARGQAIEPVVPVTDTHGIATTYFTIGSKPGEYLLSAKTKQSCDQKLLTYHIIGRASNWVFMLVIGLLGGLSLFLLGMKMMSDGMQQVAGDRMRSILGALTKNRVVAVGVGAFVTMIIQSSSATTVMLVGFVESGLMRFMQTLGIILGADIGTTVTAQIIAFKITDYSLLMIAAGFLMTLWPRKQKLNQWGITLLGFGILFFGMDIMSGAMHPLRSYDPFLNYLLKLENPLIGILIGLIFTALIQSSSAFVGIIIVLSMQGLLTLEAAIPLLFGANIGTAITAILASLNAGQEAKKVAAAHTLFKVFGVLLFVAWIPFFAHFIEMISPKGDPGADRITHLAEVVPRQIANAHTVFNVLLTLIALPFTRFFGRLIERFWPKPKVTLPAPLRVKYLDNKLTSSPAIALSLSKQEVIHMGHEVQDMINDIILPFFTKENNVIKNIESKEKLVNFLRDRINEYLRDISRNNLPKDRVNEVFQIMYTVKELEQIADLVSKILLQRARLWIQQKKVFTEAGKKELVEYQVKAQKQLSRALEVFRDVNLEKAKAMKSKYKEYRHLALEMERHHFERLKEDIRQSVESSEIHLELLTVFRMIAGHATNIARSLLEWGVPGIPPSG
ncbi:MAG: Na/Pi cotransporter family protein [Chlorobi bacterium]|nr:Na/Pi cotransporter family protein [Chlorobiota bacterium]